MAIPEIQNSISANRQPITVRDNIDLFLKNIKSRVPVPAK